MDQKRFYLPMRGVDQQRPIRGGINAAYAQVRSTGLQDAALAVMERMSDLLRERPLDRLFQCELDEFHPQHLSGLVRARLASLPELGDPAQDPRELKNRLTALAGIQGRVVNRVSRQAAQAAEEEVAQAVTRLKASLNRAFASNPDGIRTVVDQVRSTLQSAALPPADAEPLARLQRLVGAREQVQARRSSFPEGTFDLVNHHLLAATQTAYEQSLGAAALALTCDTFRRAAQRLLERAEELAARAVEFSRRLGAVRACLERRQQEAARDQHVSRASVVLPLAGPDAQQVVAGLISRNRCADLQGLAACLLDRLERSLIELAPRLCPHIDAHDTSLAELLCAIDPAQVADAFLGMVESSMGSGHTLYESIEQYGVEACARYLYHRAEPTCHLGGRDIEAFNVSPSTLTLVRLPEAAGPRDHEVRGRLRDAFSKLGDKGCTFTDGAKTMRTVTVVRLHIGWPIAIEEANGSLLQRYLRSGERGHLPHLIGLVPDSPVWAA